MCVCDKTVRESACVCVCMCVCAVWPPTCMCYVCMCMCAKQKRTDVPLENIFHTCAHLQKSTCEFPARQSKSMAASADISNHVQHATQSDDPCRQVPHLQAKCTSMSPSATPATQSEGRCRQVPHLPRKSRGVHGVNWDPSTPPEPAQRHKCHTCHAKWRSMSPSATPATQRAAASTAPNGNQARHRSQPSAIRATPATQKCHACQAKWRSMSPSATPATQTAATPTAPTGNQAPSATHRCPQTRRTRVLGIPQCSTKNRTACLIHSNLLQAYGREKCHRFGKIDKSKNPRKWADPPNKKALTRTGFK